MHSGFIAGTLVAILSCGVVEAANPRLADRMMQDPLGYASRIRRQIDDADLEFRAAEDAETRARAAQARCEDRFNSTKSEADAKALEAASVAAMQAAEALAVARFQRDALALVDADLVDPAEWRLNRRPRGVLVAVPVTRNLGGREKYDGEDAIVNIVHRLIDQDDLAGRVEVVFIEPAAHECPVNVPQPTVCCVSLPAALPAVPACDCR